jgi:vacuolar-type H+-ATPase subunit E/Vma4
LEPIWHDFILEESKDRDLDYEMNGSFVVHDAEGSMVDEDFENLVDIVLENFLHNIFSSKYFQRTEFLYDLILREVSFFF